MSASSLVDWLGLKAPSPQVKPTTLPLSYFKLPPASVPTTVPPPPANHHESTLAHPFTIPTNIYNDLLKPQIPITVALMYMSVVVVLNQVNANRTHKPWAISRTRFFKLFVILHNIFLAVYSACTCVGMTNAVVQSLPAWNEDWKVSKTVDALCKMHGPRGAGSAATYNETTSAWTMTNRLFHLAADGLGPETTDVGRIWNEGLAIYGWLFYLSKFYEVVDTLIILAKGRQSSLLQTYHHAGAMLCMWAGIRYMSPPIWMFVLVNSGIHAVMYTFYLLSAVGYRAPKWFKQTLTSLQITQFVIGATYAFLHLFVAYEIPVSVPYLYHLGGVASKVMSEAPTEVLASVASAVSTAADYRSWLKKAVLRGAGYEGVAENVLNEQGKPFGVDAARIAQDTARREETRYREEMQFVHCLDTSGQVFAILFNCVYLLPLTWLFLQFFVTSYRKQVERRRSSSASDAALAARKSFIDASKGVSRRLNEAVQELHQISEDIGDDDTVLVDGEEVKREMKEAAEQAMNALRQGSDKIKQSAKDSGVNPEAVKQEFQRDMEAVRKTLQDTTDKVKNAAAKAADPETREQITAKAQALRDNAREVVQNAMENVKSMAGSAREQAEPAISYASEKAGELKDQAGPTLKAAADKAAELKDRAIETASDAAGQAKEKAPKSAEQAKDSAKKAGDSAKDTAQKASDEADKAAQKGKEKAPKSTEQAKQGAKNAGDSAKDTAQKASDQTDDTAQKAKAKAGDAAQTGKARADDAAQKGKDTAEATAEEPQKKADDLSQRIDENLDKGGDQQQEQSEVDKFTSNQKSPNGNGTGGGADENQNQNQQTGVKTEESEQTKAKKKEEDKIIDESQTVRDEDVDIQA